VSPYGGDRGEWTYARPRRGIASEQADDLRDRFLQDQRRDRSRGFRQGQSRVRVSNGSTHRYRESPERFDYCDQQLAHDGRIILQYSNNGPHRDLVERHVSLTLSEKRTRSVSR